MAERNMPGTIMRTGLAVTLALLVGWAGAGMRAARAETPPTFTVKNVDVDQTAATAAQAREAALADGERKGLRRLLERLTPREQYDRLPRLSVAQIGDLVENFEVQSERSSAVRYIATMTFRFNPGGVRQVLRRAQIPFAETYAQPMVVLPVFRQDETAVLWDEPNPWLAAWRALPPQDGLQPLIVPLGDLTDIGAVSVAQARQGERARLDAIAGKYGAGGVIVAEAAMDQARAGRPVIQVALTRYGAVAQDQTVVASYTAGADENNDALLARAAAQTAQMIEEQWKSEVLLQFGSEATLVTDVLFSEPSEWIAVRDRLADMAVVRKTDLVALSRGHARLELHYIGSESALRLALAQKDLVLSQDAGTWALSVRRNTPAPPTPPPAAPQP